MTLDAEIRTRVQTTPTEQGKNPNHHMSTEKTAGLRVTIMAGEPGAGKTTIMKACRKRLPLTITFKKGLVRGVASKALDMLVPGVFDGTVFEGTDKLSMGVQPELCALLSSLQRKALANGTRIDVLMEGDRVTNGSLLDHVLACGATLRLFVVESPVAEGFRARRGTHQAETFLRGKRTKVAGLKARFPHTVLTNEHPGDIERLAALVLDGLPTVC